MADGFPTPHQRVLALRAIPPRLNLLSVLTTVVPGPVSARAVETCMRRVVSDMDVLMLGCTEHVQGVLEEDLEEWGRWCVGELYPADQLEQGRRLVSRYVDTYMSVRDRHASLPALSELRSLDDSSTV